MKPPLARKLLSNPGEKRKLLPGAPLSLSPRRHGQQSRAAGRGEKTRKFVSNQNKLSNGTRNILLYFS